MVKLFDESYIKDMSGIRFIANNTFHIEQSAVYKNIGECVKSVDFIRVKEDKLVFLEAKTSFPNPDNACAGSYEKFQNEIVDICDKFIHSLNLFSAIEVGAKEEIFAVDFVLPKKVSLLFILVVKNHESKWCRNIQTEFRSALPKYVKKIWKPEVYVINEKTAINYCYAIALYESGGIGNGKP